jgi:chromosome segregation ATPase
MANKKTYTIVINGIQQAVNQVDALISKINDLDARLKNLQEIKVDITASASTAVSSASTSTDNDSKSKYDAAKSEAAAQKEITDQIALQNQENLKALQNLTRRKEETKQILRIQKDIVAGVRNENGEYANTLAGRRAMLSDLKRQLANTDLGTDEWTRLRDKIKEVNDQVLEMEKSYGQFGRNVGNYESAFDGLKGFTVTIGGVERQFGSLRDASRQLKQELVNIDTVNHTCLFHGFSPGSGAAEAVHSDCHEQRGSLGGNVQNIPNNGILFNFCHVCCLLLLVFP